MMRTTQQFGTFCQIPDLSKVKAMSRSVSGRQNFNVDFHFGLKKFDWIIFR